MIYKWIKENVSVLRLSDSANIPNDPANTDWQRFQKWVAEGNTPQAADAPTKEQLNAPLLAQIVAIEVKAHRAARDCLLGTGDLLDAVLGKTPKQRLQELEDQIAVLRAQLVK